jgi:hypothetical protein
VEVLGDPIEGAGYKTFSVKLSGESPNAMLNAFYSSGTGTIIQSQQPPNCHWDALSGRWALNGSADTADYDYYDGWGIGYYY